MDLRVDQVQLAGQIHSARDCRVDVLGLEHLPWIYVDGLIGLSPLVVVDREAIALLRFLAWRLRCNNHGPVGHRSVFEHAVLALAVGLQI
eukprot:6370602-Prymnesium_polylepis.1